MSVSTKGTDCGEIAAFVGEETHFPVTPLRQLGLLGPKLEDGFVRDSLSRIGQRCANVVGN
jgi:hypothetical protein